ncbi:MAG: TldD/PmbA family protein [Burkholderiaceae bacterium]|nr:TldD/PmbA family protein [Burkholderiaceae bacterium]
MSAPDDPVFPRVAQRGARVSLRMVEERHETLAVTRGVVQPARLAIDRGAMVSVWLDGEIGYCATADLSPRGLQAAAERAVQWARAARDRGLALAGAPWPEPGSPSRHAPADDPLPGRAELIELLQVEAAAMARDPRVRHWSASLRTTSTRQRLWSDGALAACQSFRFVEPNLEATAVDAGRSQTRTLGGQYNGFCRQGGGAALRDSGIVGGGARVADEALQLLGAPNCPDGPRDLLLSPDQMMLQIHESIGHPLELDRILGDERNFAGTSFVVPEMFGNYRYGSPLLDVSFDPGVPGEFASYAADDDGTPAQPRRLIEGGVLLCALGGALSQARARALGWPIEGVACSRASGWQRAPIDRMANLNLEPGDATLDSMIASVERGIWMQTNASWSIDDSRNKFQFGCEWARLIENGRLGALVRNPNYRGISATFWRSLAAVGDRSTMQVLGTPYCGKGEPGQIVRVGHASPACLFRSVEVFGGES